MNAENEIKENVSPNPVSTASGLGLSLFGIKSQGKIEEKRVKPTYREVYVCKICNHITMGYFALARMTKHLEQHGIYYVGYGESSPVYNFRMKFSTKCPNPKHYPETNPHIIDSEKWLTESEKVRILEYIEKIKNATSPIEKKLIKLQYGVE